MHRFLLLALSLLPLASFAQEHHVSQEPQTRGVLLEEFTGIHCGFCPQGHAVAKAMAAYHPVSVIANHAGSYAVPGSDEPDFRTTESVTLNDVFGVNSHGYPSGVVNRHDFGDEVQPYLVLGRSNWPVTGKLILKETANVNLWAKATYDGADKTLSVEIEGYYLDLQGLGKEDLAINVAVLQNNILGPQNGAAMGTKYVHNHVLRMYLTPTDGEKLTCTAAEPYFSRAYKVTLPDDIKGVATDPLNTDVVVFVSKGQYDVDNVITVHTVCSNYDKKGTVDLADHFLPHALGTFAGNKVNALITNRTAMEVSNVTVSTTAADAQGECTLNFSEPLMPGERREVKITLPATLGDKKTTIAYHVSAVNGEPLPSAEVKYTVNEAPKTATYGQLGVKADMDVEDHTWRILDTDDNVVFDCGKVEYTDTEVFFDVKLEDQKTYCLEVFDIWGDGVQNPRGKVRFLNSEGAFQVQNLYIKDFGTRLYFRADASKNPSAINDVNADRSRAAKTFYSLDGRRLNNGSNAGVTIVKQGNKAKAIINR